MYCSKCNSKLEYGKKFCGDCGTKVENERQCYNHLDKFFGFGNDEISDIEKMSDFALVEALARLANAIYPLREHMEARLNSYGEEWRDKLANELCNRLPHREQNM